MGSRDKGLQPLVQKYRSLFYEHLKRNRWIDLTHQQKTGTKQKVFLLLLKTLMK
jgi:hypothetical protein